MFGLEFLFGWALLALPLAGIPVILHLLFRRKSQVVQFSTLRFIKSSIQRTAARRKIHRWLLLTLRILALALLIWAVAQPATRLASQWAGAGNSTVAAVVIDTSYSMNLKTGDTTLLGRANDTARDLLGRELNGAQLALFKSEPAPPDHPEHLESAAQLLTEWVPLSPTPSPVPLSDRINTAAAFLNSQSAKTKWLIVLTDLQSTEFPRSLPEFKVDRLALFDLQPDQPRSSGVTKVTLSPSQPMPGVQSEAVVEVVGRANESRAVTVELRSLDGGMISTAPTQMATLGTTGRTQLRLPITLPTQRFVQVRATLSGQDDMPWDDSRTLLVEVPPRRKVRLLETPDAPLAGRFVRLALDPNEGRLANWPVDVRRGGNIASDDDAIVTVLSRWPDLAAATALRDAARSGRTVVLMIQPGLETTWAALGANVKRVLSELLPSEPSNSPTDDRPASVIVSRPDDALFEGLLTGGKIESVVARRAVAFLGSTSPVVPLLSAAPQAARSTAPPIVLLARKPVGAGYVYMLGTLPEPRFTNLATSPVFLPMLVRMTLGGSETARRRNSDLGEPVVSSMPPRSSADTIHLHTPANEVFVVQPVRTKDGLLFQSNQAGATGIYTWRRPGSAETLDAVNVQPSSTESELSYRPAESILATQANPIVAKSIEAFRSKLKDVAEPQARWSWAVAAVLFLLCLEAFATATGTQRRMKSNFSSQIAEASA